MVCDHEKRELHQWFVTTSSVTYYIPRAHMKTYVSHTYHKEKVVREPGTKEVVWAGKIENKKTFQAAGEAWVATL